MKNKFKEKVWMLLMPAGFFLVIAGMAQGDYGDVLKKALIICLECIGIG